MGIRGAATQITYGTDPEQGSWWANVMQANHLRLAQTYLDLTRLNNTVRFCWNLQQQVLELGRNDIPRNVQTEVIPLVQRYASLFWESVEKEHIVLCRLDKLVTGELVENLPCEAKKGVCKIVHFTCGYIKLMTFRKMCNASNIFHKHVTICCTAAMQSLKRFVS